MSDSIFLTMRTKGAPGIYEVEGITHFFFVYDLYPVSPGHTLIVPKRQVTLFSELNGDELHELPHAIHIVYKKLQEADLIEMYRKMRAYYLGIGKHSMQFIDETLEALKTYHLPPDGYNHGLNDGKAAGQTVSHFHYHIIPRWSGDQDSPEGGVRHVIPGKGKYRQ